MMDGGTEWNINLVSVVQKCREQVESDADIILDIVSCWTHTEKPFSVSMDTFENYYRVKQMQKYFSKMNDVVEFIQAFPDIDFRYYITPTTDY
jgi:Zn-dependent M32 family carboxypeptidase